MWHGRLAHKNRGRDARATRVVTKANGVPGELILQLY